MRPPPPPPRLLPRPPLTPARRVLRRYEGGEEALKLGGKLPLAAGRVIIKRGFFNARMDELALDAMEGAHTRQSLFGRLFGYGDVRISGRGEGGLDLPVMARPGQFVAATERARSDAEHAPMDHLADELHNDLAGVA